MSARSALPTQYRRPTDAALDQLVDPDPPPQAQEPEVLDVTATRRTRGNPGNSVTSGTSKDLGSPKRQPPEPRDHVKLRRDLADQLRDAVWYLSEHGRPRVQLGELLDEAVTAWLTQAKDEHTGGEDFPRRGRLR